MELYDEELDKKKSKLPMIIGICVGILTLITVAIIICILYLQSSMTTVRIDGVKNAGIEELFYIETTEEGSQELYIPINQIAPFLGYKGYVGDFQDKSEDKTKCYVESENERAMFSLNSDVLVKATEDSEYEYITIDKEVIEKDGELYTSIDGIQKAFNIIFSSDDEFKNIDIFTMDYLITYYTTKLKIEEYSTDFSDRKSILENMIIIEKDEKYGVIDVLTEESILQTKYDEIKYLPTTTDFLVKSNKKYGIVAKDKTIKVRTVYDEIKIIDNKNGLYLVKQNNSFGVVDINGKVIIEPEYKQIGIDKSKYAQNGVENQYVLLDEIIPMKNDQGLWGFFNLKGEQITDFKYTGVGCKSSEASNSHPAVIIPSYNIIVVESDNHYNLMTLQGEELITGYILDTVYLKSNTETAQNQFFMTYNENNKVINVEEYLKSITE